MVVLFAFALEQVLPLIYWLVALTTGLTLTMWLSIAIAKSFESIN